MTTKHAAAAVAVTATTNDSELQPSYDPRYNLACASAGAEHFPNTHPLSASLSLTSFHLFACQAPRAVGDGEAAFRRAMDEVRRGTETLPQLQGFLEERHYFWGRAVAKLSPRIERKTECRGGGRRGVLMLCMAVVVRP